MFSIVKKYFFITTFILVSFFANSTFAEIIDFESLGLNDADPVGTIGIATFEANASIQGSSYAFITNVIGNGTGFSFPFNAIGNVFITNPGGVFSSDKIKLIRINFIVPISNLSFYVADVDSSLPTIEQLKAEVFDQVGNSLSTIIHTAPTGSNNGDGTVQFIDFGNVSGITKVDITLKNIGTNVDATAIGFGLDYIEFEYSPPSIEDILTFFDFSVVNESLLGDGNGNSADSRLNAFRNMLEMVGDLIYVNDIEGACGQLKAASMKCDGSSPPPDFVTGDSAEILYNMILNLMVELGCE